LIAEIDFAAMTSSKLAIVMPAAWQVIKTQLSLLDVERENCSIIVGQRDQNVIEVHAAVAVPNQQRGKNAFSIAASDWRKVEYLSSWPLLGCFHTHGASATASASDRRSIRRSGMFFLIGSARSGKGLQLQGFLAEGSTISTWEVRLK
jgi:proteasome lid subunit RPN8/RPN11